MKKKEAVNRQTTTDRALVVVKWITIGTVILFSGLLILAILA